MSRPVRVIRPTGRDSGTWAPGALRSQGGRTARRPVGREKEQTMTTYADKATRTDSTPTSWPLLAALAAGVALVLAALGTFWDFGDNDSGEQGMTEYLFVVGIIAVATAIVFGLVVRTATPANAGTRAAILVGVAAVSILVFWSGLPPVLAIAAIGCALVARRPDGSLTTVARVVLPIAGLVLAVAVYLAFMG
jgi:hypothetical protein